MKKTAFVLLTLILAVSGLAQELIRNSDKPQNPQAGRVLKLEPVFEISDASGEFFFKYAYRFAMDDRGFLYVLDDAQLLQFSPEGNFVRNFYKKGQGPGELASPFQMVSFICGRDSVFVYDGVGKIIQFDAEGKVLGEVKQTAGRFFTLFGMGENGYFMQGQTNAPRGGPAGFKEVETEAHLVSLDGSSAEKIIGFTSRIYQGPNFGMDWDNYLQIFNPADGSLYVSHTGEYKVVRANLLKRTIVTSFTRDYPRIKFNVPDDSKSFYEKFNPPKKEFENDIRTLFVCDNNLWVKTSTVVKDKGMLFDVFDPQGRFLDSFYLNVDGSLALARGGFIYVTEKDKDENILLRKYKVLNGPKE
jgi:6-bladed beta-propeller